jgi:hypothetical protein
MLNPKESSDAKIPKAVGRKGSFKLSSDVFRSRSRAGSASMAERTCGWSSSTTSYCVVNVLVQLLTYWAMHILPSQASYPSFKMISLDTLL